MWAAEFNESRVKEQKAISGLKMIQFSIPSEIQALRSIQNYVVDTLSAVILRGTGWGITAIASQGAVGTGAGGPPLTG